MKKIAFGIACFMAALYVCAMMLTLYGRNVRQQEADTALSQAIDSTLSSVISDRNYTIENNEAFVADFLKALLIHANSDSDISIAVLEADYDYGILSVEVTEKFAHPNGKRGSVSEVRTVIFDKEAEKEKEIRTVAFYSAENELYKEYELPKGCECPVPVPPKKEGEEFCEWRFVTGGTGAAQSVSVTYPKGQKNVLSCGGAPYSVSEDTKLIAVFREK